MCVQAAKTALPLATKHTVGATSHRTDGSQTIEHARVVLEDHQGRILVLCANGLPSLELPGCATGIKLSSADADEGRHTWDSSNLIGPATEAIARLLPDTGVCARLSAHSAGACCSSMQLGQPTAPILFTVVFTIGLFVRAQRFIG